ncbi:MAG TPA: hypothetical protein VEH84_18890, partial [Alphaproteobacteria bacterium]|nr:hypothetical protein [Alphaproteobacteria bacterium]
LSEQVFRAWDYQAENRFADATEDLARALEANAAMRLLIVHGLYDLVTPYFASEWLVGQMRLPEAARARIALRNHPGGHMLYLRPDGRAAMAADAAELYGPGR